MSPSRGLTATHTFSRLLASQLPNQIYLSTSTNPHVNLSLEHHLFTTLPSSCRTLLLYRNTPSIILGRNQNPWLETSHSSLLRTRVQLLRRRSGGGTVYHDLGNTNYSVTVPTAEFDRDKHALMVSRALRNLHIPAAVNGRHDIVVLPSFEAEADDPEAKKCSGSAYKLTRHRSYHHGTMLLNTDLGAVKQLLKSPAKDIITARGVASVPSPVVNTKVTHEEFSVSVLREWEKLYGSGGFALVSEAEAKSVDEIAKGIRELKSEEWVYGQTPKAIGMLDVRGREDWRLAESESPVRGRQNE
ncbi:hypothetical protein BZA77DRAFT_336452 [Pyronema omphalodes]|nr:hypothetical protein BZA77DRAFT_336452 [Pyronema omphalodes]